MGREERHTKEQKKREKLEERVSVKLIKAKESIRDREVRELKERSARKERKLARIARKQERIRVQVLELDLADHEEKLTKSNCILTQSDPQIFWVPAIHNEESMAQLEQYHEETAQRIAQATLVRDISDVPLSESESSLTDSEEDFRQRPQIQQRNDFRERNDFRQRRREQDLREEKPEKKKKKKRKKRK